MELTVYREIPTDKSTEGELQINGNFECFTLEPVDRGLQQSMSLEDIAKIKIQNQTAIPYGRYRILMQWSNHFQKMMPHLQSVPGYEYVMLHPLNFPAQTEGCIGVGEHRLVDQITESGNAFIGMMTKLGPALANNEDCFITIIKKELPPAGLTNVS